MIRTDSGFSKNINWVFVGIISIIFVAAMWSIRSILMLAFAAVLLTVFVSIPVRFFVNRGVSRPLAIVLANVLGIVSVVVLMALVLPTLVDQFRVLFADIIPQGVDRIIEAWNRGDFYTAFPFLEDVLRNVNLAITPDFINQALTQIVNALGSLSGSVVPLVGSVANVLLSTLIIFFLCVYFLAEPQRYLDGVVSLTPLWYRDRMREILVRIDKTIRAWWRVTAASMLVVGIGTAVGLAIIGVEQWAALGVLSGVLSFIPNFGPLLALIPSIAVAVIQAPESMLLVVVIIYGVSFLQSQIIGPLLASESMNLAPVLVLIGQIVFGVFFGFLGVMLAVPLTALTVDLVSEIYVKDVIGDKGQPTLAESQTPLEVLQPETD